MSSYRYETYGESRLLRLLERSKVSFCLARFGPSEVTVVKRRWRLVISAAERHAILQPRFFDGSGGGEDG